MKNTRNQINHISSKQKKEINRSTTVKEHQKEPQTRGKKYLQFVKVPFLGKHASGSGRENEAVDICI